MINEKESEHESASSDDEKLYSPYLVNVKQGLDTLTEGIAKIATSDSPDFIAASQSINAFISFIESIILFDTATNLKNHPVMDRH